MFTLFQNWHPTLYPILQHFPPSYLICYCSVPLEDIYCVQDAIHVWFFYSHRTLALLVLFWGRKLAAFHSNENVGAFSGSDVWEWYCAWQTWWHIATKNFNSTYCRLDRQTHIKVLDKIKCSGMILLGRCLLLWPTRAASSSHLCSPPLLGLPWQYYNNQSMSTPGLEHCRAICN